jgi:hypothetical protein
MVPMDDPKQTLPEPLEAVVTAMSYVEKEMDSLRAYLETHDEDDKPLLEWPVYTRYTELHSAVAVLDRAVDGLHRNGTIHSEPSTHRLLAEARDMSLSTSKATIYAMQLMSEKTSEYAKDVEDNSLPSPTEEIASNIVACQVGKLLEHSTEATKSVWLAVDVIQELHNANVSMREESREAHTLKDSKGQVESFAGQNRAVKKWDLKNWITLGCILCCILLTILQELRHPTIFTSRRGTPDCVLAQNLYADLSHAYSLFQKSYEESTSLQQAQHNNLIELDNRYHNLQGILEDQNERIDNVWEALGPPNANGTYHGTTEEAEPQKCDCDVNVDGKLRELRAVLMQQVTRVEEDTARLRQNMHLADIRLSGKIRKIENKVY